MGGPNSVTQNLSHFIDIVLKPLCREVPSFIRDDLEFLNHLPKTVNPNSELITFDIVSLYTNIPHDLGITAVKYWLENTENVIENRLTKEFILASLKLILERNIFTLTEHTIIRKRNSYGFEDQPDPDSNADMYSWNPCQPFNEGDCMDVAVCNVHNNIPNASYFTLGDQDSAVFSTSGKVTKLTYIYAGTGGAQRSAEITLTCDKDKEGFLDVKGEIPLGSGEYFFELQTKYACVDLGGISIGTIILIAFLCFIVVYLVLGMSIQTFVRKASGKQRIPNYSLWSTVPGLVKDGTVFVVTRGKRTSYSNI
ncbi:unnamed protein product [Mytilus edulis]|uniref:Autophagy-related protein 27 n=1 Tax=Mytilus edulis TaxID=6550 RepID=A0A8S3Q8T0_MYTED|nr:unnamed protein product [Mytilus edulis]